MITLKSGARFLPASLLLLACRPPLHVTPVPTEEPQVHQSGGPQAVKPGGPLMVGVGVGVGETEPVAAKPAGNVMVGVGDIASCTQQLGLATAMLVDSIIKTDSVANVPTTTFTLGDNVYSSGTEEQFARCFTPSWGNPKLGIMKTMHPTPGNHDYETPKAAPYYQYFGKAAGVDGEGYYKDLERIRDSGVMTQTDMRRCVALANYIARLHKVKREASDLYVRTVRDLVGHGECIMGLIDSYSKKADFLEKGELKEIEEKCVEWRWKLKDKSRPLSRVHGDFHPFNVMFRKGTDFTALDRSRAEWGEAADDVAAMSINYLLFSIQVHGRLASPFDQLYELFMKTYFDTTRDDKLLEVIQPFYVWRSLVVASPIWYPNLGRDNRRRFFNFIRAVLDTDKFDVKSVNSYLGYS